MPAQVNIGYFFRLLYNLMSGSRSSSNYIVIQVLAAHVWFLIVIIGYLLSIVGFFLIVYMIVRLFELRKREEAYYSTLISPIEATGGVSPRWQHIESLINDTSVSYWREAIMEADIMLDDVLAQRGYVGNGVSEKLKAIEPADMKTLQDAWDVHKIRNQVAHEGSTFDLSELLARRTIARYEAIFRELKAL